MGFSINTTYLPRIHSYEDAARLYAQVEPIRGSGCNAGIIPMGERNKPHMRWETSTDANNQTIYHAVLYRTRCVSFYPDNTFSINTDYASQSTAAFIDAVIEYSASVFLTGNHLWFCKRNRTGDEPRYHMAQGLEYDMSTNNVVLSKPIARRVADRDANRAINKGIKACGFWDFLKLIVANYQLPITTKHYRAPYSHPTDNENDWIDYAEWAIDKGTDMQYGVKKSNGSWGWETTLPTYDKVRKIILSQYANKTKLIPFVPTTYQQLKTCSEA